MIMEVLQKSVPVFASTSYSFSINEADDGISTTPEFSETVNQSLRAETAFTQRIFTYHDVLHLCKIVVCIWI